MTKLAIKVLSLQSWRMWREFKSRKKKGINADHNLIIVDLLYLMWPVTESGRELSNLSYKGDGATCKRKVVRGSPL
jgi:hypothetical protein